MWIAPSFALLGVLVGVLLEPLKALFSQGAKNRQLLIDRCADIVRAVHASSRGIIGLNEVIRRGQNVRQEQLDDEMNDYNSARKDLGTAVALLQLTGPDDLFAHARDVESLVEAMHQLVHVKPSLPLAKFEVPAELLEARDRLDAKLNEFTATARPFTRPTWRRMG